MTAWLAAGGWGSAGSAGSTLMGEGGRGRTHQA